MPVSEDKVREELKKVIDPELFVNIIDLGLVYTIDIKEKETVASEEDAEPKSDVSIEMTLTSPACPAGPQLIAGSKNAVSQLEEVDAVIEDEFFKTETLQRTDLQAEQA